MKRDLTKVTGANVSVKITDEFMKAVENNETFSLQFPVDAEHPEYSAEVDAASLWNEIIESATTTAEPGLLMWDNITKNCPHMSTQHSRRRPPTLAEKYHYQPTIAVG